MRFIMRHLVLILSNIMIWLNIFLIKGWITFEIYLPLNIIILILMIRNLIQSFKDYKNMRKLVKEIEDEINKYNK